MVCAALGFTGLPVLMNGEWSVIAEAFGPGIGDHAQVTIGVAALPFNVPSRSRRNWSWRNAAAPRAGCDPAPLVGQAAFGSPAASDTSWLVRSTPTMRSSTVSRPST